MTLYNGSYTLTQLLAIFRTEFGGFDNFTIVDDNYDSNGSFCVKYNAEDLYLDFWKTGTNLANAQHGSNNSAYMQYATSWACATGIGIEVWTAWNASTHVGSGTRKRYFIPSFVEYDQGITNSYSSDTYQISVQMWIDKYGFIGATQNATVTSRPQAEGIYFICEFVPTTRWEYDDGHSDMFWSTIHTYMHGQGDPSDDDSTYYMLNGRGAEHSSITDWYDQTKNKYAFKSSSNSKVYFNFPFWYENKDFDKPVYKTKRWFFLNNVKGISTNDIISWLDLEAATVRKFLCVEASCSQTTTKYYIAIPYENPILYT